MIPSDDSIILKYVKDVFGQFATQMEGLRRQQKETLQDYRKELEQEKIDQIKASLK